MTRRSIALAAVLATACSPPEPSTAALEETELAVVERTGEAEGPDAVPRYTVAFPGGAPMEVIAHVPRWRDGAAVIDPARRLYEVRREGARRMIAADVIGVATDGARLAWVTERGFLSGLWVDDAAWVEGWASIAVLAFDGDAIWIAGAPPGGVMGLHVVTAEGARCRTNCELRTGTDWGDRFVPLPAAALELDGDVARWVDHEGQAHEVAR